MKNKVAVVVFCTDDSRVLMHRRRHPKDGSETWLFLGGAIKQGEESLTAAKREVLEEVGYAIPKLTFFRSYPEDDMSMGAEVFLADFPGMDAFNQTAEGDKRQDLRLVSLDDATKLPMIQMAHNILRNLKSNWGMI